jgi:YVTN family beta-propeller protein
VAVIDAASGEVRARIKAGGSPWGVAVSKTPGNGRQSL